MSSEYTLPNRFVDDSNGENLDDIECVLIKELEEIVNGLNWISCILM